MKRLAVTLAGLLRSCDRGALAGAPVRLRRPGRDGDHDHHPLPRRLRRRRERRPQRDRDAHRRLPRLRQARHLPVLRPGRRQRAARPARAARHLGDPRRRARAVRPDPRESHGRYVVARIGRPDVTVDAGRAHLRDQLPRSTACSSRGTDGARDAVLLEPDPRRLGSSPSTTSALTVHLPAPARAPLQCAVGAGATDGCTRRGRRRRRPHRHHRRRCRRARR